MGRHPQANNAWGWRPGNPFERPRGPLTSFLRPLGEWQVERTGRLPDRQSSRVSTGTSPRLIEKGAKTLGAELSQRPADVVEGMKIFVPEPDLAGLADPPPGT